MSQLYACTPPYLLGIDEIFQKRYCMTLELESLQSYHCSNSGLFKFERLSGTHVLTQFT